MLLFNSTPRFMKFFFLTDLPLYRLLIVYRTCIGCFFDKLYYLIHRSFTLSLCRNDIGGYLYL